MFGGDSENSFFPVYEEVLTPLDSSLFTWGYNCFATRVKVDIKMSKVLFLCMIIFGLIISTIDVPIDLLIRCGK